MKENKDTKLTVKHIFMLLLAYMSSILTTYFLFQLITYDNDNSEQSIIINDDLSELTNLSMKFEYMGKIK